MPTVPASLKRLAAMTTVALAVTGLAAKAVAVGSQGSADASFTVQVSQPPTEAPPTTTAPLPPVSIVPLPPGTPVAAPSTAGDTQSLQQTMLVVINGGTMSVSPTSATVVLHRNGNGRLSGDFGPITVVDARG